MKDLVITVKTLFGFEELLRDELNELGYPEVEILNRAVQLNGDWEDVYRLNYRCRLAISVLVKVKSFTIHKEDDLYKEAKKIDWTSYFDMDKTFAVKGAVFSTLFKHTQYPFLLVKDAIADVFREKCDDKRPDVNLKSPQVMFDVYIKERSVVISLNTSGVPLFQRGYRQEVGDAPMNEVLAAGILRMSGWDRKSTLIDPMCGSGTIAIEAALWAADIPAMIERSHFAFKNFKSFDAEAWEKVRNEGNQRPIKLGFDILASDIDGEMIKKARRNSRMAPIGNMVTWDIKDALELTAPDDKGILICNPPYGERMGEEVDDLYIALGDLFKQSFLGYDCWVVSSNIDALKNLGLRPSQKIKVFNGNLECSLRQFQIFAGTKKYDNSEEEEDGTPAKPRGVRREKRQREISVAPEGPKTEETPISKYGTTKSTYAPAQEKEKKEERKETPRPTPTDDVPKEYNPTRRVISTEPTEPRKSAASKYTQAKSAYLPVDDEAKPTPEIEEVKQSETPEESPAKKAEKPEKPRLGASKYGEKPKFLSRYAAAIDDSSEEKEHKEEAKKAKPADKEDTLTTTDKSEDLDDSVDSESADEELSLKEKIELMKKSRKEE
ncbi:MAG TPA: THUMP domain-containing protein [Brumimicrobium sp.]|nr:THUMP domain-containing protein [Brumimicrobium sp.]